jgi:hypothetical protein
MPELREVLGLETIPHFTTLQKFFRRMRSTVFDALLHRTVGLFEGGRERVDRDRRYGALLAVCERILCTEEHAKKTSTEALHEKPDCGGERRGARSSSPTG